MFVWSALLRVLLSLSLILNGMSAASAAARMSGSHQDMHMAVVAESQAATTHPSCHHHEEARSAESGEAAFMVAEQAKQAAPDCCESGACRCDCVHAAQAGPVPWTQGGRVFGHTRNLRPSTLAYASPALRHLIRPPIG